MPYFVNLFPYIPCQLRQTSHSLHIYSSSLDDNKRFLKYHFLAIDDKPDNNSQHTPSLNNSFRTLSLSDSYSILPVRLTSFIWHDGNPCYQKMVDYKHVSRRSTNRQPSKKSFPITFMTIIHNQKERQVNRP